MNNWLLPALIALVIYGFWGFFPKLATQYISPRSAIIYQIIGSIAVALWALNSLNFQLETHPKGILYAVLTGMAGFGGTLFFYMAVQKGNVSSVVTLTAMYPVITIMLAYFFLHEPITIKQFIGFGFAGLAIYLMST